MRRALLIILAVLLTFGVEQLYADEASQRKLAEELLLQMKVDQQIMQSFEQMKAMQRQQMESMSQNSGVKMNPSSLAMQDKIMDLMGQEMSWDKLKDAYVGVYVETFTEEDLQGLINFYKSPTGQKLVEKTPELSAKVMEIGQKQALQLLPKIKEITSAATQEMQQKTQEKAPDAPLGNAEK